jgi:hypothetical protein
MPCSVTANNECVLTRTNDWNLEPLDNGRVGENHMLYLLFTEGHATPAYYKFHRINLLYITIMVLLRD